MTKDPAFLFYSKDWLEGTAEMLPEEKGVYIDLLAHQHQKGDLPSETIRLARIVGLGHDDFIKIWNGLKGKFILDGDRFLNKKLNEVMGNRQTKGINNKIAGIFGYLLKKVNPKKKHIKTLREEFKIDDFKHIDSERYSERISEWFYHRLAVLETEDANANEIVIDKKGVKKNKTFEPPNLDEFKIYFIENGYTAQLGEKAFNYYKEADWHDSRGHPVKNWKQKVISVWFKEENKQQNGTIKQGYSGSAGAKQAPIGKKAVF